MAGKIGLALGAGSIRGFAHIGVLQVLEEHHIPVDMISGSSIGSIMAAIYAAGTDLKMLEKFASNMDGREYIDIGRPTAGGLVRGNKVEELVNILCHNKNFDETVIPLYIVACDAGDGSLRVFHEGKVSRAARASMAIPGVFMPADIDGRRYVDGGVLERIPCEVLRREGADLVIGVDVGYCGGEVDVSHINAYDMINRAIDIMQWEASRFQHSDAEVVIIPEVLDLTHGTFDTKHAGAIIKTGRDAAEKAIPKIEKLMQERGIPFKE